MSDIDLLSYTLAVVLGLGGIAFAFNYKTRISTVPVLLALGVLAGPVTGMIDGTQAGNLFDAARVIGLVTILFAEGQSLQWPALRKHLLAITLLDTVGLLVTALIAGVAFAWLFHAPLLVGLLFGAIIAATDPATLVPLFHSSKIDKDTETLIVAESIFNDPLGIVLTLLVVALMLPQAANAQPIALIGAYTGTEAAAIVYFVYVIGLSVALGLGLGIATHWIAERFAMEEFAVLLGLSVALGGFVLGDKTGASGYLVATIVGIVMGNHHHFFPAENETESRHVDAFVAASSDFQNIASALATVMIFVLLGASLELSDLNTSIGASIAISMIIIFVARPFSVLPVLMAARWRFKPALFVSLEGPRGVVPAALSGLPLALGQQYHDAELLHWGPVILGVTLIVVLISVVIETLWVDYLKQRLLDEEP